MGNRSGRPAAALGQTFVKAVTKPNLNTNHSQTIPIDNSSVLGSTAVSTNSTSSSEIRHTSPFEAEPPIYTRSRGNATPSEIEDEYNADIMREMSRVSLNKIEEPQMRSMPGLMVGSAENTAVIRYKEERKLDDYRLIHRTEQIPGRITEDQLKSILTKHR
jgi:hypothetical protein